MGSIPSDRYVASVRYLLDLMTFLLRPDTSPWPPLCFAPLPWYAAAHYLIWIFQDIKVGYANGDVAWKQNEDTRGYFRITGRDYTKDI
jgi:hypothetical protein